MKANNYIQVLCKRLLLIVLIFQGGLCLKPADLMAQQYDIKLDWNNQVACSIYDNDKFYFFENLEDADCIQICDGAIVQYSVSGNDVVNIGSIDWTVTGGSYTILPGGLGIEVDWNSGIANGLVYMAIVMNDNTLLEGGICVESLDKPNASFNVFQQTDVVEVCLKQDVYFNNTSIPNPGGQIIGFYWDFGDGTTSSAFEPMHTYTNEGYYTVKLTVWNECNCEDTYTMGIKVKDMGAPPEISCPTVTCENSIEKYQAISENCRDFIWTVEGGTILNGQGSSSIDVQWDHVDPETGFGWIYLEEKCNNVCTTPTIAKVPVVLEKIVIQGDNVICRDAQYRYSIPKWPTTEVDWILTNMGGTNYSNYLSLSSQRNEILINPDITLPIGAYKLRALYHNTLRQCSGTGEIVIEVRGEPSLIFGPKQICIDQEVEYTTNNPNSNAQWTLKNQAGETVNTQTGPDFQFSFPVSGDYMLTVDHPDYCPGEPFSILVHPSPPIPQGNFDLPQAVCPGISYTIGFTNTDPNINPDEYIIEWIVENGEITGNPNGEETEVIFTDTSSGNYTVSVRYIMKSSPFCPSEWLVSDIIPRTEVNTVIEPFDPISGETINNDTFCTSTQVSFRVDDLDGEDYEWEFSPANFASIVQGQGTAEIAVNLHEISQNEIQGDLSLKIRKCGEWFDVTAFQITKIPAPIISWNPPTQICADELFSIVFSATIGSQPIEFFDEVTLDLGNGTIINDFDPIGSDWESVDLFYPNIINGPTTYIMTLTVRGPGGCAQASSESHQITVYPTPVSIISASDPTITYCEVSDIIAMGLTLTATETGGIVDVTEWRWYIGGDEIMGITTPTLPVTEFGIYTVEAIGANECSGISAPYEIIQGACDGGGGTGIPCNEWFEITNASWTGCDQVEVNFSFSSAPNNITWTTHPSNGLEFVSIQGNTAYFNASLPGNYSITAIASWACGAKRVTETVMVAYKARLHYSISCNIIRGGYDVTLHNDSPYIWGHQPDKTTFYVDGSPIEFNSYVDHYSRRVDPGIHTFQLEIGHDEYPSCFSELLTVDLTSPTASFDIPPNVCAGEPFTLEVNNPDPTYSYMWEFNNTTDVRSELEITLDGQGLLSIFLIATDRWGCSAEASSFVLVNAVKFEGRISGYEEPFCQGEAAILSYDPGPNDTPVVGYQWIMNGNIISGANSPIYQATTSGLYGVVLTGSNGCSTRVSAVSVNFITPPTVFISGPAKTCLGNTLVLNGYTSNEAIERRWLRNGNPITSWGVDTPLRIEDTLNTVGVFTYTLQLAGACPIETDFIMEVFPNPEPEDVQLDFHVSCVPLEIVAMITNPDPNGTYNWTNGDTGAQTNVYHSGILGVIYTNGNGCSTTKEVQIPELPEEHLWVFPTGCIEACEGPGPNPYVIGPLPEFHQYAWLWDSVGTTGYGGVEPEDIYPAGDLQLQLGMDLFGTVCETTSDPLYVSYSLRGCEPCEKDLSIKIKEISLGYDYPFLHYVVNISISNPYPFPLTLQLSATEGIFIPGSLTLSGNQTQAYSLIFIPDNGISGGVLNLSIQLVRNGEFFCQQFETFKLPFSPRPKNSQGMALFSMVPNPAEHFITVYYDFGKPSQKGGTAKVYSLTGVMLRNLELGNNVGQIEIELAGLSAATYIVVLQSHDGPRTQQLLIKK